VVYREESQDIMMQYRQLGQTSLKVSVIGLGTMTLGEQNTEQEGHAQLDYALENGINFIDTAEIYPVPTRAETQGETERIIGTWIKPHREKVILATKVAGPAERLTWVRGGPRLSEAHLIEALEGSLKRLQTDYIDLYQLHWPERHANYFGQLGYQHHPKQDTIAIETTLKALAKLVESGKVRHIGLSNETPWGVFQFLKFAEAANLPRVVSIQNPYNLLNRSFEVGLAEVALQEQVGLLAYSPLAFGKLTGKYFSAPNPAFSRLSQFSTMDRYNSEPGDTAAKAYVDIAEEAGLLPAQVALAFINQQPFVTSNIIGATTIPQLKENIQSIAITLDASLLEAIEAVHKLQSNPCP
jgi:aryl-alcohol dehydrogenase-like predicted oxidoreductase